jgi:hypothetical protein
MLNQLPEISAPHPPHILKTFFPLLDRYEDLTADAGFRLLATDVCRWVNCNPVSWEPYVANPDDILTRLQSRDLPGIFAAISEGKAKKDGAEIMCCKSMESVSYIDRIEGAGLRPVYIHLYRDGRDVALSFMKAVVGPKHIYTLAHKWKQDQQEALAAKEYIPAERFVSLRYEDLLENPEAVLQSLCRSLRVNYHADMLRYFESGESKKTAHAGKMWENLERPILSANRQKFMTGLTTEQLVIFESVAGDILVSLGYSLVTSPEERTEKFTGDQIKFFEAENKRLIAAALAEADPEDLRKRRPQEELLREILNR